MFIYAICIKPLLQTVEEEITGVKTGNGRPGIGTVALAYADDNIFLTRPEEIQQLQEILDTKNHQVLITTWTN